MIFKRVIMSIFSIALMAFSPLFLVGCAPSVVEAPPPNVPSLETLGEYGKVTMAFPSISDIHFSSNLDSLVKEYYPVALKESLRLTNNRVHAVIVPGDFSEGYLKDYDTLINYTRTNIGDTVPLIASYGNHEGNDKHAQYVQKFGKPIDNVTTVNGYNFIAIGAHASDTYLKSQATWLDGQLSEMTKKDANKPVFILIHHPVYNTNNPNEGNPTLSETLRKYPQAFVITGHDHSEFSSASLWQGEFNSFRNSFLKSEVQGQYALIRVTDKNYIVIKKYGIKPGEKTVTPIGDDFVINFNEFLASKK